MNSRFEVAARELRAKLLGARHSLAPQRGWRGGRRMVCEPSWGTRRRDILRPATVPPMRRPTDVRKTSDSHISHAIPPAQEATHAQKPQNINDSITRSEIQSGELHAKLQSTARVEGAGGTCRGAGGRQRDLAGLQDDAPISTPGTTGVEGAGGICRGARGRWRGLAGLRDDAPSAARGADGSRAGRRPPAHTAAGPSGARNTSGARRRTQ